MISKQQRDDILVILNDALAAEPRAISALFRHKVDISGTSPLIDHPTIQVLQHNQIGFLGLLNGLVGVKENGEGHLAMLYDQESGLIHRFIHNHPVEHG